mgnify:CR=1 FL=1
MLYRKYVQKNSNLSAYLGDGFVVYINSAARQ